MSADRGVLRLAAGWSHCSLRRRRQLQPSNQPRVVTLTLPRFENKVGEYVGTSGAYMNCILDATRVIVQFNKGARVKVTGTATVDALAPGMYVQFRGTFTKYGKGTEPITAVVIYSPDANTQPGAYPAGNVGSGADEPTPGKKKGPAPTATSYQISGKITSEHKHTISVDCGNLKVKAEVAPDATVKLETSDLSWASSGDKLTITGGILGPGRAICTEATIELAAPLTGKKKSHVYHAAEKSAEKSAEKVADKPAKTTDKSDKATDKTDKTDKTTDKGDKATDKSPDKTAKGDAAPDKAASDKAASDKAAADKAAADKSDK